MSPATADRDPPALDGVRLLGLVVALLAAYALLWVVGQTILDQVYTAAWVARRLAWLFAPVTLLVAVWSRRPLPPVLSVLGLVLGVAVGELVGGRVFALRAARLERELAAGGLQSWEPAHPGWWIASLVFVAVSTAGVLVTARRPASSP